jgi:4-amino-4-deoxy-L-arabinose transferase-like glycosyltransferase
MSVVISHPAFQQNRRFVPLAWLRSFARPADQRWTALVLLSALCGFLFFYGLTTGEFYRTEGLRAIIAAEFLHSGNWIVPTLYGEPLLTKPPGMYAAIALASWPTGVVTEWTARLPSAVAATITVFLIYWYFRRQLGDRAGLVAAVITPMSFMWLDKAIAAEIDMLQTAWVAAAILFFLRALEAEEQAGRPWGWWLASLMCVAGGVLTKWTAPVFFYGTVVPLLWWRGRLRLLFGRHHLVSAALGAGVCFAWAGAAIYLSGWQAFYETVSREALQRLSPSHHLEVQRLMAPHHHHPIYPWLDVLLHPLKLLGMNLPWSAFALLTLRPGFAGQWDERGRRLLQALHCWTWPSLVFWSVIPEHAARHSFPLFPGLTGLAAMVWIAWIRSSTFGLRLPTSDESLSPRSRRWTPARVLVGIVFVWLVAKLVFVHEFIPRRNPGRQPQAKGEQLAACVPPGQTLYLFRLKDEGIMFYYSRAHPSAGALPPVVRLPGPAELPVTREPLYCVLDATEAERDFVGRSAEVLLRVADEQGAPMALVEIR